MYSSMYMHGNWTVQHATGTSFPSFILWVPRITKSAGCQFANARKTTEHCLNLPNYSIVGFRESSLYLHFAKQKLLCIDITTTTMVHTQ